MLFGRPKRTPKGGVILGGGTIFFPLGAFGANPKGDVIWGACVIWDGVLWDTRAKSQQQPKKL